jgi:hydrogenase maturation protease
MEPMSSPWKNRPVLVLACGNPSRGDDALGPLLIERLQAHQGTGKLRRVDLLTDFQLQIEHALDMQGRELVIFVDATSNGPEPFSFEPVQPERDTGYSTHAVTPGALLPVFEQVSDEEAPATWLLAIRGYGFDLGSPVSERARENLEKAVELLLRQLIRCTTCC